jgi:hypothetical protein
LKKSFRSQGNGSGGININPIAWAAAATNKQKPYSPHNNARNQKQTKLHHHRQKKSTRSLFTQKLGFVELNTPTPFNNVPRPQIEQETTTGNNIHRAANQSRASP